VIIIQLSLGQYFLYNTQILDQGPIRELKGPNQPVLCSKNWSEKRQVILSRVNESVHAGGGQCSETVIQSVV
jgi:hypothetical protein